LNYYHDLYVFPFHARDRFRARRLVSRRRKKFGLSLFDAQTVNFFLLKPPAERFTRFTVVPVTRRIPRLVYNIIKPLCLVD